MKIIKYQLCTEVNRGTEEKPSIEQIFFLRLSRLVRSQRGTSKGGSLQRRIHHRG